MIKSQAQRERFLGGKMLGMRQRWEKESNDRYYEVYLVRDLLGWDLMRAWGRRGTSLGQVTHIPCDSFESGLALVEQISKKRLKKHYQLVFSVEKRSH